MHYFSERGNWLSVLCDDQFPNIWQRIRAASALYEFLNRQAVSKF
jgi:hypothetical protein